jgi:hypothetical protein
MRLPAPRGNRAEAASAARSTGPAADRPAPGGRRARDRRRARGGGVPEPGCAPPPSAAVPAAQGPNGRRCSTIVALRSGVCRVRDDAGEGSHSAPRPHRASRPDMASQASPTRRWHPGGQRPPPPRIRIRRQPQPVVAGEERTEAHIGTLASVAGCTFDGDVGPVTGVDPSFGLRYDPRAPSGSNSAGRVSASQAECRGFESRLPLQFPPPDLTTSPLVALVEHPAAHDRGRAIDAAAPGRNPMEVAADGARAPNIRRADGCRRMLRVRRGSARQRGWSSRCA